MCLGLVGYVVIDTTLCLRFLSMQAVIEYPWDSIFLLLILSKAWENWCASAHVNETVVKHMPM